MVLNRLKIVRCWVKGHSWLLQREEPKTVYKDSLIQGSFDEYERDVAESIFHYQCQECGKPLKQIVRHIYE